jgi:hypothetical protein
VFAFASLPVGGELAPLDPVATFREAEGLTVILEEPQAIQAGLKTLFRAAWITLEVQSELAAVGLTAAVSTALAKENIPCNIVAAAHHDHLFVPVELGQKAMEVLLQLQGDAALGANP